MNITLHLTFLEEHGLYRTLMKFFDVLPKENKILSVRVQDKSCNSPEDQQPYLKDTPTRVFSCEFSKNI